MGLPESDSDGSFIAAEFDTNCNNNLGDMNVNLVGVNLSIAWGLEIAGIVNQKEGFHTYNVSDNSVVRKPSIIPVSSSGDKHHKRLDWGLGISGPTLFCVMSLGNHGKKVEKDDMRSRVLQSPKSLQARGPVSECKNCGWRHFETCRKLTQNCYNCGQQGHYASRCAKPKGTCFKCGEAG